MGSTDDKKSLKTVAVETANLRQRLNSFYECRKGSPSGLAQEGLFQYLWDLKEKALMERKETVEVPGDWLEELEEQMQQRQGN